MKKVILIIVNLVFVLVCYSQKNVIILIPDGTSTDLVTLSRLYKWYADSTKYNSEPLYVDKLFCGMIKTYCADNKFPDSAPTSTAYASGMKTIAPYIGMDKQMNPQISVMELAKMYGYATGLVVTCEFPHATPADFLCHFNDRESKTNYKNLAKQMIYNTPDVLFAGGYDYIKNNYYEKDILFNKIYLFKEYDTFKKFNLKLLPDSCKHIWGLFSDYKGESKSKSYQCDIDKSEPSLSEMTKKTIGILDTLSKKNKKGFFLMIEGSQIDWANHYNDPFAAVTEFIEFDNAVKTALDYAATNDSTLVIVCPDHGTGGLSIGNKHSNLTSFQTANFDTQYDKIDYPDYIIKPLSKIKCSSRKIADTIISNPKMSYISFIQKNYNLPISKFDSIEIRKTASCDWLPSDKRDFIEQYIGNKFSEQHFIGWTTTGHTGEDVFLGIQAPKYFTRLTGIVDNSDIGYYICSFFNFNNRTDTFDLNIDSRYYTKLTPLAYSSFVSKTENDNLVLTPKKQTKILKSITLIPNVNYYLIDNQAIEPKLKTLVVKINNNFYVPIQLLDLIKSIK